VVIKEAPETLEDEDLIEMVNAGLMPLTVTADFLANFWKQVFPKIKVHEGPLCSPAATLPGRSARTVRSSRPLSMISSLVTPKGVRLESDPGALPEERKVCQGCRF